MYISNRTVLMGEDKQRNDLVVAEEFRYRYQAEFVREILKHNKIYTVLAADDCGGYYPNLGFINRVKLLVERKDYNKAVRIIKSLKI